jgi:prefoldin subunit 5
MIDSDENDLVTEIEQQLTLANEEVQGLQTDVQSLQGSEEALAALFQENQELNATIENLSAIIKKRDDALRLLLAEVTNLNTKIREIRSELQMKNQ